MEISTGTALAILGLVLLALLIFGGCKKSNRDNFTRTCMTADSNCRFVRSPVDYAFESITEVPQKIGKEFPHYLGNPTDKLQPLDQGHIDLVKDEGLLWNQDRLFKQYENNWKGCGNGKPYIVNDEKTRFSLADVGDMPLHRQLNGEHLPQHGPVGSARALTDEDMIMPLPFDSMYGGRWLPHAVAVNA